MHVVATAGHVDHGKSALVKALTGHEPDRLAQERDRGLTIELGYVWTSLPGAGDVAFVDVPGHERFITTTLAGLGPVPVVLFVVAADDPWMPQAAEHLAALDALGVRRGLLVVTRTDLAEPTAARERALAELAKTSLRDAEPFEVSAHTGDGLSRLRRAMDEMLAAIPAPDPQAAVRLWVDRAFTRAGAGTVVTGTLASGKVRAGDRLSTGRGTVRVRALQSLGRPVTEASATARVALNVTGDVNRGDVLTTPDAWHHTDLLDVRLSASHLDPESTPPQRAILHVGAATATVHTRPLGDGLTRLRLDAELPLRIGDRALLRDPGTRRLWGITVLDPAPPPLLRRGAPRARAAVLSSADGRPELQAEVARRGLVSRRLLHQLGVPEPADSGSGKLDASGSVSQVNGVIAAGDWLMSAARAQQLGAAVLVAVREHAAASPLEPALTLAVLATHLGLPRPELVAAVVAPPLHISTGRVVEAGEPAVPPEVTAAVTALRSELAAAEFAAPPADRLAALGLNDGVQAAAIRAGLILRPGPGIMLLAGADTAAARLLAELPQPFTASQARQQLGTTRRVALPLLAHLDHTGRTRRLPDDRRTVTGR